MYKQNNQTRLNKKIFVLSTGSIGLIVGAVMGSTVVASAPEPTLNDVGAMASTVIDLVDQQVPAAQIEVVTHHHTRILNNFKTDLGSSRVLTSDSVASVLREAHSDLPEYQKLTYTHTLKSDDGNNKTIDLVTATPMFFFKQVGFPHIETGNKRHQTKYKPYSSLMKIKKSDDGSIKAVPNVACHGYSAERTEAKAAKFDKKIQQFADKYNVDRLLVKAVIAQESCFRNHAVSHAGAAGLMQLMPETARWLGVEEVHNPTQNLKAGIRYLSQLKRRFKTNELVLAAYNAGPGNVDRYNGIPPFSETRHYVKKVMHNYHSYVMTSRFNAKTL